MGGLEGLDCVEEFAVAYVALQIRIKNFAATEKIEEEFATHPRADGVGDDFNIEVCHFA